nr:cytochrome b6/f subunit L [Streptosarcina sp. YL-2023a]
MLTIISYIAFLTAALVSTLIIYLGLLKIKLI